MIKHSSAWILAAFMVLLLRAATPVAAPMNDAQEYLSMATQGFGPQGHLSAPFCYRPAVPLLVWALSHVTGAPASVVFSLVTLVAAYLVLLAVYYLALLSRASGRQGLSIMLLLGASLFVVRFSLHSPFYVDIEAVALSFLAFACLLRRRYAAALLVSLIGLFFKEFLLVPLFSLAGMLFLQYLRDKSTRPLGWATLTVALAVIVFLLPRLLIPVDIGYGANFRYKPPEPSQTLYLSQLRSFLAWPPRTGIAVNLLLALVSFWLPALMLLNAARLRRLWQTSGGDRLLVLFWVLGVLLLASVGGTNVMIFVVYTAPVLVLMLALLLRMEVHWAELVFVVLATVLFNRMFLPLGTEGGDPSMSVGFYGGYWHLLSATTVRRFVEAGTWIIAAQAIRLLVRADWNAVRAKLFT